MLTTHQGVFLNRSLFPSATCGADSLLLQSKKYSIRESNIKVSGAGLENLQTTSPQKHVQTTSEIQLTTFQQRQGILPDSSISNNCHVFMYLSPIDNRLLDIKVPLSQPPYSFLSHLYPVNFFYDKVTHCKS